MELCKCGRKQKDNICSGCWILTRQCKCKKTTIQKLYELDQKYIEPQRYEGESLELS